MVCENAIIIPSFAPAGENQQGRLRVLTVFVIPSFLFEIPHFR
jgi:hypothetical protein